MFNFLYYSLVPLAELKCKSQTGKSSFESIMRFIKGCVGSKTTCPNRFGSYRNLVSVSMSRFYGVHSLCTTADDLQDNVVEFITGH